MEMQIFGLASAEDYQNYHADCPYSQQLVQGEYCLAEGLPEVAQINQVTAALHCKEYRPITNSPRPKVVLWGELELKLAYTSLNSREKVHGDLWGGEVELVIEIPTYCYDREVAEVRLLLEDLRFRRIHGRKLALSYLCFAYLVMED